MRSKVAQRIMDRTSEDVKIHSRWMAKLAMLIHDTMVSNGTTQKKLAENMSKKPSEINKWVSGEHNFTLRSLAKLQAELGVTLIEIPTEKKKDSFKKVLNGTTFYIHKPITKAHLTPQTWQKPILKANKIASDVG